MDFQIHPHRRSICSNPCNGLSLQALSELRLSFLCNSFFENTVNEGRLPGPENTRYCNEFPNGKRAVIFCKLFSRAPVTSIKRPLPTRRSCGTGIARFPDRYCPVMDLLLRALPVGVPAATISPPDTRSRTDVNQTVASHFAGIFIMFYYDQVFPKSRIFFRLAVDGHCPSGEDRWTAHLRQRTPGGMQSES